MPFTKGFTPKNLQVLRKQIDEALKAIDPALTFDLGKMTFSAGEFSAKLTTKVVGLDSQADEDLIRYCKLYKFDQKEEKVLPDLGLCKLVSFKSRNRTYPWIVTCAKGRYKIEHHKIEAAWGEKSTLEA